MKGSARAEAERIAASLRRAGYPDAEAAWEYCIDGQIGSDKFFTRTISVYAGDRLPKRDWPLTANAGDSLSDPRPSQEPTL